MTTRSDLLFLSVALLHAACASGPRAPGVTEPRLPEPLDLRIGMSPDEVREVLPAGVEFTLREDDKPIPGKSHKAKLEIPVLEGYHPGLTLYFVGGRLWQLKLRPGQRECGPGEKELGKPAASGHGCKLWALEDRQQGAVLCDDKCQLFDMQLWTAAGEPPETATAGYAEFLAEVQALR